MKAIKGKWNIVKGRIKQQLARFAEDDLQFAEGIKDELVGRIQIRTAEIKNNFETHDECCCRTSR